MTDLSDFHEQQYWNDTSQEKNQDTIDLQHNHHPQRQKKRHQRSQNYSQPVQSVSNSYQDELAQITITNIDNFYDQSMEANYGSQIDYQYNGAYNAFDVQNQQQYLENADFVKKPRRVRRRKVHQSNLNTTEDRTQNNTQEYGNDFQLPVLEENQEYGHEAELEETNAAGIIEYADEPLLPLAEACEPLSDILYDLSLYVNMALQETPEEPPDGLTIDESAAVRLYTIEWEPPHRSLYSMLNHTLKYCSREELRPYFRFMKLFLTALVKIPCCPSLTVWRGVTKDLSAEFPAGTRVTWWAFSSTTTELTVLENNMYLGKQGARTLFSVEAINGRTIKAHSHFVTEDEILLLPGTHMIVQSLFSPANDLYIIHLKQVIPDEVLLAPPFEGASLFPKPKRPWYRKKRLMIPLCLAVIVCIVAAIVGGVIGSQKQEAIVSPFGAPSVYDTGPVPSAIVYGYFNDDKYVDIAVMNLGDRTIDILLNSGNGTYPKVPTYVTGIYPIFITVYRVDKDNTLVVVVNNLDGTVSIGNFNLESSLDLRTDYPVCSDPQSAICGDFNNDKIIDVAVACGYDSALVLLLSDKNQSFVITSYYSLGYYPIDILSVTFKNDSSLEFVILDAYLIYIIVLEKDIDYVSYLDYDFFEDYAVGAVKGDFDGDNITDFAILNGSPDQITFYLGGLPNSGGTMFNYPVEHTSNSITTADLNNDGILDLILTVSYEYSIDVLLGDGHVNFSSSQYYSVGNNPMAAVAADFNNDSFLDIAVANGDDHRISVLINDGHGKFTHQMMYISGEAPVALVAYHFTNDKELDLLVANSRDSSVALLIGNRDGTFRARIPFELGFKADYIAAGDFDNNSLTDLVVTNRKNRCITVLLTLRPGILSLSYNYSNDMAPESVATSDFNGDGYLDIVVVNDKNNSVSVFLGYSNGTFKNSTDSIISASGRQPSSLALGDFNGDKILDLAVICVPDKNISVLLGDGQGAFSLHQFYKVERTPADIIAARLATEWLDIVVANGDASTISVLYNLGKGDFDDQMMYSTAKNPTGLLSGDFNGDGLIDLSITSERANSMIVLINKGDRLFSKNVNLTIASPTGGICHDLNNDGHADVAVISKNRGLYVYINQKS